MMQMIRELVPRIVFQQSMRKKLIKKIGFQVGLFIKKQRANIFQTNSKLLIYSKIEIIIDIK